jgi:hypothetical protein
MDPDAASSAMLHQGVLFEELSLASMGKTNAAVLLQLCQALTANCRLSLPRAKNQQLGASSSSEFAAL